MALDLLAPIRLGIRLGIGVVRFELEVIEHLLGLDRDDADVAAPAADAPPFPPAADSPPFPPVADSPPTRTPRRPAPKIEPDLSPPARQAPEPELEPEPPVHIDTEPELVAEFAEPGAEDGAGAEIRIDEPWNGYRKLTAGAIRDRLAVAGPAELAVIQLYEGANRNRRSVLDAVERRAKQLANAPAPR